MKKVLSLLVSLVLLTQFFVSAGAVYTYEGEGFSISLPDGYDDMGDMSFVGEDGSFSVNVAQYGDEDKYSIYFSSDKDMKRRAALLTETANAYYKTQGSSAVMKVVSTEKFQHQNGKTVAVTVYKTASDNVSKNQIVYEFTCLNNLYTVTYTGDKTLKASEIKETFNSFTIEEKEYKGFISDIGTYIGFAVVFGVLVGGIIRFIRTPAKRKKGKL